MNTFLGVTSFHVYFNWSGRLVFFILLFLFYYLWCIISETWGFVMMLMQWPWISVNVVFTFYAVVIGYFKYNNWPIKRRNMYM